LDWALVGLGSGLVAKAVVTFDSEDVPCPNGGIATLSGSINTNEQTGAGSISIVQDFDGCKATSESSGRLWTFDGDPNITTTMSGTDNPATGISSMTGSITGAIKASSDIGSGRCVFNVQMTSSYNDNTGASSSSINGSVCGRTITFEFTDSGTGAIRR
jgi:hypothetical protein